MSQMRVNSAVSFLSHSASFRMATKLADETLAAIIEGVLEVEDDDFASFDIELSPFAQREYSNADVLLVCKRWMRVGTPPLFHTCIIRSTAQSQALAKALKISPFGTFVRRVRIEGSYGVSVKQFLEKATNIQELAVAMPEASKGNAKPTFSMLGMLQLRRFILCNYKDKQNSQTQYALQAIVNMLKNCKSLVRSLTCICGDCLTSVPARTLDFTSSSKGSQSDHNPLQDLQALNVHLLVAAQYVLQRCVQAPR